jgi:integrase
MAKKNLTKTVVEALPLPEKKGKQVLVWDAKLNGFGVRLTPAGRVYIVQGRVNGMSLRYAVGKHGLITADNARRKALKILADMDDGIDPRRSQTDSGQTTLREWAEQYKKHKRVGKDRLQLKEASKANIDKHLKGIFKKWADKPISEITRDKVLLTYRNECKRSAAQTSQAFRELRAIYNWALVKSTGNDGQLTIPLNPVMALKGEWKTPPPRTNKIPEDKIGIAWNYLQSLRDAPFRQTRTTADMVCFIMLTGARFSEAATLPWAQVDFDGKGWRLPDPKNRKPITLPLSSLTIDILKNRPQENEFVFPGRSGGHIKDCRDVLTKLSNHINHKISPHDLRRTFAAVAKAAGGRFTDRKLLLNHSIPGDVKSDHYDDNDLRNMMPEAEAIAKWITRQATLAADNIVDLATRRATA